MDKEIVFATSEDEEELQEIFTYYGMGIAGDIDEHILMKQDNKILAGAMVSQIDSSLFHLLVFAVQEDGHNRGIGSRFLQEVLRSPGQYCKKKFGSSDISFKVTTVAKGEAARFYEKNGFVACDFSKLVYPYDVQCDACHEKVECSPVAMMFTY